MGRAGKPTPPSQYRVVLPDGTERTYLSPVEAKVAVRRAGGGSIYRQESEPAGA